MTRFVITDPGTAAHSAKNKHAAPGLPNQSRNHSGRNPMVGTKLTRCDACDHPRTDSDAPCEVCATSEDLVVYTLHELNRLVSAVAAREVAGRLRERAVWHRERAATWAWLAKNDDDPCALWHEREAKELDKLALRELAGIERGER